MALKLHELATDNELKAMVAVEHEAYDDPFNGFWEMLKCSSQDEFCARQLSWHRHDPSSHWLYVTDEETGDVVGGIQWNIYGTDPYAKEQPPLTAYWFPEGPMRQVGDQISAWPDYGSPSLYEQATPLVISYCFVHTAHRKRGAAGLMLKWGADKADELDLEAFVESTDIGRKAYEKHSFYVIDELNLDTHMEDPSEEFQAARKKFGCPMHAWVMKRDPVSE
ncbi:hypothetical protein F5Y05DRAFT_398628 [Hypoxylon sp. FL0543]|nr:hypothetical protein F5Y05DRAFT_398628 [Hypoxylon sp. FL0543]